MRKILITGGFGFIGSHLTETLLKDSENQIHVIDNLSTSSIDVNAFNRRLGEPKQLTYDACTVKDYFKKSSLPNFDEIYHLASVVGPVGVLQHAGKILQSIIDDMYLVAHHAQKCGARLCDVSTSEVYGGGRDGYCSEKDSMIIPPKVTIRLEYAVAKLGTEVALMNMTKVSDLHATIVRPFNVAGPRQAPQGGFVLPRFILQALGGEPLTVYGDGKMVRAFTHVQDIVDGIILTQRRGQRGLAYNIGNPANKTTIVDLAEEVVYVTGSTSKIHYVDPKALWGDLFEEANDKYPDADRATQHLGWTPRFSLHDTIKQTAEYIKNERRD